MAFFDTQKPFSFSGIKFPFKSYKVSGGIRKHVHEYPHTAGGALEKLGRRLYEVTVSVDFTDGLDSPKYRQLVTDLGVLRGLFEDQVTDSLHIPHIGTIKACADEWTEEVTGSNRSTIKGELKFIEDQSSAFLVLETITVSPGSLAAHVADFSTKAKPFNENIFSSIDKAANSLLAIVDQSQLFGSLVAAKVEGLSRLIRQADESVKALAEPANGELLEALHRLWDTVNNIRRDIQQRDDFLRTFTVPLTMSVGQISAAVYGDSSRGGEILQLNAIDDPLNVPAGFKIHYYDPNA
ncbi:MAG: DNA circularization N-terminal domain-containing protein [Gemmatimonadaceae bacterium]|nr:DNA circularization N-terminal domain-containing protein [Gemmatimonadaceae bacterium]